jgi:hypothetical protein
MSSLVIAALVLWAVPPFIGGIRGVDNLGSIFVIDLFLGWTLIGWVVALAMACKTVHRVEYQESTRVRPSTWSLLEQEAVMAPVQPPAPPAPPV